MGVEFAIVHNDSPMTRRPWRCNCDQTANIATKTCRRLPRKRGSALTSARSVRIAPRTNSATSARTAAAVLSRGQSGRRRSGGPDYRLRSGPHRTSGRICHTVSTTSRSIRRGSGIFRPRIAELPPIVIARSASDEAIHSRHSPMCNCTSWMRHLAQARNPYSRSWLMGWTAPYGIAMCQNEVVANLRQVSRP